MPLPKLPNAALDGALRLLTPPRPDQEALRRAAWVARCVGRGAAAPLTSESLSALAGTLQMVRCGKGTVLFAATEPPRGVWIVKSGRIELTVGDRRPQTVVDVLRPSDVDGDIQLLLDMPLPYTGRVTEDAVLFFLSREHFESLLATSPPIARRWLSSVAERLAASHMRLLGLLGRSLPGQLALLLLDEAVDGTVRLPQRTLAAMLGAQRPSLNKILKEFERAGLIEVRYSMITIRDTAGLSARAAT